MSLELKFENLQIQLGPRKLFHQLNHHFKSQEITALLGPSGCGKSTWLKIMAGLETRFTGRMINSSERVSFVFQEPRLIPWLNLKENILLGASSSGKSNSVLIEDLKLVLQLVQLETSEKFFPHQLSGGMKMRASIARALINQPDLILFDEPFSALDELLKHKLQLETRNMVLQQKCTGIFVTHSVDEAVFLADEILILGPDSQIKNIFKVQLPEKRTQDLRTENLYFQELNRIRHSLQQENS